MIFIKKYNNFSLVSNILRHYSGNARTQAFVLEKLLMLTCAENDQTHTTEHSMIHVQLHREYRTLTSESQRYIYIYTYKTKLKLDKEVGGGDLSELCTITYLITYPYG